MSIIETSIMHLIPDALKRPVKPNYAYLVFGKDRHYENLSGGMRDVKFKSNDLKEALLKSKELISEDGFLHLYVWQNDEVWFKDRVLEELRMLEKGKEE